MDTHRQSNINLILLEKASQQPDSIALLAPGRLPLDYATLYGQIEYCSRQLAAMGLTQQSRIAVVLPNGPEMAACCLSVTACAVCAPLNPDYKLKEFQFYLDDLRAEAVIVFEDTQSPAREAALELGLMVIDISVDARSPAGTFRFTRENPAPNSLPDPASSSSIALVLHTSGTTSKPKIVPLSHANLCASASNIVATLRLGPQDRCLNVMPLFHIHGFVAALLAPLLSGGSLVCSPGYDSERFFQWVNEFLPTWYTAVPTIHQSVLQIGDQYRDQTSQHQFRFIRSSSAALPPTSLAELEALFSTPVVEAYGMTEGSHQIACNPLPPKQRKPGSVGLPIGPEVAIMDKQGNLLEAGKQGEIVIRGENVTSGYENQPDTAAYTGGWLRTGDQGQFDEDGYLFLTGRLKEIVNRGGEKISPREVDEALLEHPSVAQAVAFAVPHALLGEDLNAAVVLHAGKDTTGIELREFAFQNLTTFKVPSEILILETLPKNATGKIQRLSLAEKLASHLKGHYVAPETETEQLLVDIFSTALERNNIGIHDNFFFLGGDSLRGTRVIVEINAELDLELPGPSLFQHPTIQELARHVDAALTIRDEELEQMVMEIENLSDEEVAQLLETPVEP
jgi:acyl-CoA synthetase (AMP-forming)/AMP-acid ligase II